MKVFRKTIEAHVLVALLMGCSTTNELADASAPDAGHDAASVDAVSVDAASVDARDAASIDAPQPIDAGAPGDVAIVPIDAPGPFFDAPWDPPPPTEDAGACISGTYTLEGTPIAYAPISLSYAVPGGGWRDAWRDADGTLRMHFIAADLETITSEEPFEDAAFEGETTYFAEPTDAVRPGDGARLVVFESAERAAFYVAIYGADGTRQSALERVNGRYADLHAAWTGEGFSVLASDSMPSATTFGLTLRRIELDAIGHVVASLGPVAVDDLSGFADGAFLVDGDWLRMGTAVDALESLVWLHADGTTTTRTLSISGTRGVAAATYDAATHRLWLVTRLDFVPDPRVELTVLDARSGDMLGDATYDQDVEARSLVVEDATTVGILERRVDASGVTHLSLDRVRVTTSADVVLQSIALAEDGVDAPRVRYLPGRYALAWGPFLDEAVLCP